MPTIRELLNDLGYTSRDYDEDVKGALLELQRRQQTALSADSPFEIEDDDGFPEYLYINVPSKNLTVTLKLDDEGIVIDAWPLDEDGTATDCDPVIAAHALYADFDEAREMANEEEAS